MEHEFLKKAESLLADFKLEYESGHPMFQDEDIEILESLLKYTRAYFEVTTKLD